jgi:hypothetical protein
VLVAIDGVGRAVEAVIEPDAVGAGKMTAIGIAHMSFLAAYRGFAAFEVTCFGPGELATPYALRDAMLLKFTALVDGGRMAWRRNRSVLGNAEGGAECEKSDAKQRGFHGVSPCEAAGY